MDLPEVSAGLRQAGATEDLRDPDLAVVTSRHANDPEARRAWSIVVLGRRGRRPLHGRSLAVRRLIGLPNPLLPHLIVPVDRRRVASYAIRTWASAGSRFRRIRNEAAAVGMSSGVLPDLSRSITIGLRSNEAPFLVTAAAPFGVPGDVDWFLTLGLGDPLTRAAFQLFPRSSAEPSWVLKFARVAGYADPFDRDERGLLMAAQACRASAAHAPRLLGRLEVGGLPASVEEAGVGERLTYLLQSAGRRAEKVHAIEDVAAWIVEIGRQSAAPSSRLATERIRLETDVIPHWRGAGAAGDLLDRVPDVPAVLQHNDLGCWNLVIRKGGFMAVDWESARRHGLPLWDLVYFLVDALVHLDGAWAAGTRQTHAARLLLGKLPSSAVLFRWVRAAVQTLGIPDSAVGPIVTLGWMHHGVSKVARRMAMDELALGPGTDDTYGEWMAELWLREPGLGPSWSAWSS